MIVSIERGLEAIKRDLEKRGYKTFFIDENRSADIIVYNGEKFPSLEQIEGTINFPILTRKNKNSKGALLINGKRNNVEEIIEIMNKGSYSPLFE